MTEETDGDSSDPGGGPAKPRSPPTHELSRGMSVGRYVVLEPLGHGGMGVVYAAFDPQLDRKVALKLVRPDLRYGKLEDRRAKLLQEAKTLAQLSHPNVVAVHDIGTFTDQVFMAMEFMAGGTLADWLHTPRDWRLVLERFLEAGEGLAAAHRQNIVHLDFKPENVLLDAGGLAHVTDFGLAWTQQGATPRGGTNSYKAPEQRLAVGPGDTSASAPISPATDQFSFCVALYRALAKEAPYVPPDAVRGAPRPFPAGSPVPVHVRRALERGLSAKPGERFPSMDALLHALRTDPSAKRRRVLAQSTLGLTLVVTVGAAVALASRESPKERAQRECVEAVRADADELWGASSVAGMRTAFATADPAHGAETFDRVAPRVEPEVRAWAAAAEQQCLGGANAPGAEALSRCLASRRRVLNNLAELFRRPDAEVLENAVRTVILEVLPVASCRSASESAAAPLPPADAPPPASRDELQNLLGSARVLKAAGKYPEAIVDALRCAALAEEAHAGHLEAEAELLAGQLFAELRRLDAEPTLKKAVTLAETVGADEERAEALIALAGWYAQRGRPEEASDASQEADAVVARLGRPDLLEAERLTQLGTLRAYAGEREEARQAFDAALTLRRRHLPEEHPLVLSALANRAGQLPRSPSPAQLAQSRSDLESVLATCVRVFGESHPQTALAEYQLGRVLLLAEDFEGARLHLEHATALAKSQEDADPARIGRVRNALSRALAALGRWPEAMDTGERGVELLLAGNAPDAELEGELRRLLATCDNHPCPAEQRARLQKHWEQLGH